MKIESIGKNIRKYRKERNMRQEDLAEKVGLSTNYVGAIERCEKMPSLETFIDIANALGVSADMILYEVIEKGFSVKDSLIGEKLEGVSAEDRGSIYDVVDTMIRHMEKNK